MFLFILMWFIVSRYINYYYTYALTQNLFINTFYISVIVTYRMTVFVLIIVLVKIHKLLMAFISMCVTSDIICILKKQMLKHFKFYIINTRVHSNIGFIIMIGKAIIAYSYMKND